MGILRRLLGLETRSSSSLDPDSPYIRPYWPLLGTSRGSPEDAVSTIAVAARCVNLISEGLASLPLTVIRKGADGGRATTENHPLHRLLNESANDRMTSFELRDLLYRDLAVTGNAYARIVRDGRGAVVELWYMPARMVGIERLANGRLRYSYNDPARGRLVMLAEEVVHLRYKSRDGEIGVSPLGWSPDAIALVLEQADLAITQAKRGLIPDISFETDHDFGSGEKAENAFRRLKDQLTTRTRKMRDSGDPLLLEAGLSAKALAASGREAQFHESRVHGHADVARLYGVPLSVVGLGENRSYGSLTEESRALVQNCFTPWAGRGEAQLAHALLSAESRRQFTIAHDLSGLLRGDVVARLKSYEIGIRAGIYAPNECRVWDGLPRREGGDEFLTPMNMAPSAKDDADESQSQEAAA